MPAFAPIRDLAAARHGGNAPLDALLDRPATPEALRAVSGAERLGDMTRRVFSAGFSQAARLRGGGMA